MRHGAFDSERARAQVAVAVLVIAMLGLACGSLDSARRHTYPPNFNYISDTQLESVMWQLAAGVRQLEEALAPGVVLSQGERVGVITTIESMEAAAGRLGPEGWPSNHADITFELGGFRDDLTRARRAVASEPPSYRLAREIPGACLACHMEK